MWQLVSRCLRSLRVQRVLTPFPSNEVGHLKRACPQELVTVDRPTVSCALCGEEGHRVRDCTQERQKPREPRACKVCEATDHLAKDCPNREKRTCRNCGSEDHMAKECDIKKCRNCDSLDHEARDCTAPKDWSRVKCRNWYVPPVLLSDAG